MAELGEFVFTLLGIASIIMAARIGWIIAEPIAMKLMKMKDGELEWHRGTAKGRPPVRYVKDGWGRVVYMEIDPTPPDTKE